MCLAQGPQRSDAGEALISVVSICEEHCEPRPDGSAWNSLIWVHTACIKLI